MAQQPFGVRFGYATETTVKVMACSISSANVTITVNGSDTVLSSMAELGTDSGDGGKPRAGYTDSGTITGLSAFTQYTWTATQGANSISGTFYTAPSENDDFCFYVGTCEANTYNNGQVSSMWEHVKAYTEAAGSLPVVGLLFVDDHGYWDFNAVSDNTGAYAVTGVPWTTTKAYDYALGAFAHFGVYDAGGDPYCEFGQDADRIWGMRNINYWPQWGDHDTGKNEMGWDTDPALSAGFTNSKAVWDAFMLPLQPPFTSNQGVTGANSWVFDVGCCKICAPDFISVSDGDGTLYTAAPTNYLTDAQIDDVLSDLNDSTKPFKFLAMQTGIKYMSATQNPLWLTQNPLNLQATEYPRLFTDTGNPEASLMENKYTNGLFGHLVTLHGDYHLANVVSHKGTGGTLDEWFTSICVGTWNGSGNTTTSNSVGDVYDGSTVEWLGEAKSTPTNYWGLRVEVYGSKALKEVHFNMIDRDGVTLWSKKLIEKRGGNDLYDIDTDLSINVSSGGASPSGGF